MSKTIVPFGEWRPDIALLDNEFASVADGVFAGINSYKPIPSLLPYTNSTLPTGPACGLAIARLLTGGWRVFGGSSTRLYSWTGFAWNDVTRLVGGNYSVPATGGQWSFAQFGSNLIAVSGINDIPQTINVDSGTNFADLAGSPPHATSVHTVGDFVVLAGLGSNPRKV